MQKHSPEFPSHSLENLPDSEKNLPLKLGDDGELVDPDFETPSYSDFSAEEIEKLKEELEKATDKYIDITLSRTSEIDKSNLRLIKEGIIEIALVYLVLPTVLIASLARSISEGWLQALEKAFFTVGHPELRLTPSSPYIYIVYVSITIAMFYYFSGRTTEPWSKIGDGITTGYPEDVENERKNAQNNLILLGQMTGELPEHTFDPINPQRTRKEEIFVKEVVRKSKEEKKQIRKQMKIAETEQKKAQAIAQEEAEQRLRESAEKRYEIEAHNRFLQEKENLVKSVLENEKQKR